MDNTVDPRNESLTTVIKKLSGPWTSCDIKEHLVSETLNHIRNEYDKIQKNAKWRLLLALLTLEPHEREQLGESLPNLLDATDQDTDQWVQVISQMVRRWLQGPQQEGRKEAAVRKGQGGGGPQCDGRGGEGEEDPPGAGSSTATAAGGGTEEKKEEEEEEEDEKEAGGEGKGGEGRSRRRKRLRGLDALMDETVAEIAAEIARRTDGSQTGPAPYFEPLEFAWLKRGLLPPELQAPEVWDSNPHCHVDQKELQALLNGH